MITYELNDAGKILEFKDEVKKQEYKSLEYFLDYELDVFKHLELVMMEYIGSIFSVPSLKLKNIIKEYTLNYYKDQFDKNEGKLTEKDIIHSLKNLEKHHETVGMELFQEATTFIIEKLDQKLNNKKSGGTMFKNLKQAKAFTAHLDAIANEIENLDEIDKDTKEHLAKRIDKLADLIEMESEQNEAEEGKEVKAYGMGSGSQAYDANEASYMGTFGGTGALTRDADEPYMDQFAGADHQEVLKRKEPSEINGKGLKEPQPSDNYNEKQVADTLKNVVTNVVARLKK